jgi:hypothetical protein
MAQLTEGLIPRLKEVVEMCFGSAKNLVTLVAMKAVDEGELQGIEPELARAVVSLDMHVFDLDAEGNICGITVEARN